MLNRGFYPVTWAICVEDDPDDEGRVRVHDRSRNVGSMTIRAYHGTVRLTPDAVVLTDRICLWTR
jgi:hypothetical protein